MGLREAGLLLAGFTVLGGCAGCNPPSGRPNIILIVLDTARADRFSYQGWSRETTPHIDAFAQDCVDYRRAHSVAPWTLPAHMSMFTGLPPAHHGATWAAFSEPADMSLSEIVQHRFVLDDPERLLARRLQQVGYHTVAVSNNPWISHRHGFGHGFDALYGTWSVSSPRTFRSWYQSLPSDLKGRLELDAGDAGRTYLLLRDRMIADRVEPPFFVFLNFADPHFPYIAPREFVSRVGGDLGLKKQFLPDPVALELQLLAGERIMDFERLEPLYDAELLYLDFVIGKLLDWLRDAGHYDRSLIILTADHGEHLGERGRFSHQLSVAEELLRIPLLIKYPDGDRAGTVETHPLVSNLDIYQTVLAAAGVDVAETDVRADSQDLASMEEFSREYLVAEHYYSEAYLRQIQAVSPSFDPDPHRVVRRAVYTDRRKYVFHDETFVSSQPIPRAEDPQLAGPTRHDVRRLILETIEAVGPGRLREEETPKVDPAWLEKLESLGYLIPDDEQLQPPDESPKP